METRDQILTELQEIAPILGSHDFSRLPYTVPSGYFKDFSEILMMRIHLEKGGFQTSGQEISELSPRLSGLQQKNPYQVPVDFFENILVKIPPTDTVLNIVSKQGVESDSGSFRIVKRSSFIMRAVRYAAAACIVALLGITIFNLSGSRNTDPLNGLTAVSDQDMTNYLDSSDVNLSDLISPVTTETASLDFTDNEIHELLSNVSDAELEQYMPALPIENRNVN